MAENKKSFILYSDLIHTVSKLPNDKAGELFKHILSYVNDENPVTEDLILQIAFEPIKLQLKRDLKKWENYVEKQSENGKKGGRPIKPKLTQKTQAFSEKAKKADTVTDTVTVTVTDREGELNTKQKLFNEISDFELLGYTFGLSELVAAAFDQFLKYRFERKEPIVSGVVIEKMIKDMWIRSTKDEDMIRMIEFTIAKSAKNIITDCDLSAKIETESEREARIRKNWDTPIGTLDRLFG